MGPIKVRVGSVSAPRDVNGVICCVVDADVYKDYSLLSDEVNLFPAFKY
jgi:hypothetical protein